MKKILMLGGSYFQIVAVKKAKELGYHVITCDYLPDNPAHQFADEYRNVSTTDMEAVLELAKELEIDGIVAYASDPSAPTAAYVAEQLGLPGNPYGAVHILTHKDKYRNFLRENGFACPRAISATTATEFKDNVGNLNYPFVIKPIDSSGSRGVTVITEADELDEAIELAFSYSRDKIIIGEEYVEKDGYQVAGDGFVKNGKLAFRYFANEHFDMSVNGIVPIGESFPYIGSVELQDKIHAEVQRLLDLLEVKNGALNFDIRIGTDGKIHLMEVGPRNGGNLIPEVTHLATGVDMVEYTILAAMGEPLTGLENSKPQGFYSSYIIHALKPGRFGSVHIEPWVEERIVSKDIWKKEGEDIKAFSGSDQTIGSCIIKFDTNEQMLDFMDNDSKYVWIEYAS